MSVNMSDYEVVELQEKKSGKRKVLAFGAALLLGVGAYGVYASGLTIADDSAFNAGEQVIDAGCQGIVPVTTTIGSLTWSPSVGTGEFTAIGMTVGAIEAACVGEELTVWAMNGTSELSTNAAAVTISGTSEAVTLPIFNSALLTDWAVVVEPA